MEGWDKVKPVSQMFPHFAIRTSSPTENRGLRISGLQTYPNLHPPPRVGPPLGCFPRWGANLCRFVPVRSIQTRASGREFVHICFGLLGPLMQVGANSDGFGAC